MCRNLISVDWRGNLYDCDFNQMLELNLNENLPQTIFDFDLEKLEKRKIVTAKHCFGCTAGAGSSCGGTVA
jgi:radical SAM protein with 4Fe4S-binding SPASM domain